MRVAVAVDGSTSWLHAVRALIDLLGSRKDVEVHVVNVQPPVHWFDLLSDEKQKIVQQWQQEVHQVRKENARRCRSCACISCRNWRARRSDRPMYQPARL